MVTTSVTRHRNFERPGATLVTLTWAVAGAMVIAVAAIVIALIALAGRPAPAPASLPTYHYTGTVDGRCMPTQVIHAC
jgi:hypothetical protein